MPEIYNPTPEAFAPRRMFPQGLDSLGRSRITGQPLRWCDVHQSPSLKEEGDEDGFDCQVAHLLGAFQPCQIGEMWLGWPLMSGVVLPEEEQ